MDIQRAIDDYKRAMEHCENLAAVHRAHGGGGAGRRFREVSLNRAIIIMAIAAWQAVVQDLALAALEVGEPATGSATTTATYRAITGPARTAIYAFSTPNEQNTRRLFVGVGYEPRPYWMWTLPGGHIWHPSTIATRLDEWLKVRHAIAHGDAALPHVDALSWVRTNPGSAQAPALRLQDAESCVHFLRRLVEATAGGLADELGEVRPVW